MTIHTEPLKSVSDIERTTLMTFLPGRIATVFGGRRWRSLAPLAVLIVLCVLIAIVQSPFYGLLAAQLNIVMVAIAIVERDKFEPDPEPEPPAE